MASLATSAVTSRAPGSPDRACGADGAVAYACALQGGLHTAATRVVGRTGCTRTRSARRAGAARRAPSRRHLLQPLRGRRGTVRSSPLTSPQPKENTVANINESLAKLLEVDGALCGAVVDANSGMMLGKIGTGMDLDLAAAGNTEVMRAKLKTMKSLGLNDSIEDILITLGKQYHIIRPVVSKPGLFIYLVLDKSRSNLALARRAAQEVEQELQL
jgi:hypothetical protein